MEMDLEDNIVYSFRIQISQNRISIMKPKPQFKHDIKYQDKNKTYVFMNPFLKFYYIIALLLLSKHLIR